MSNIGKNCLIQSVILSKRSSPSIAPNYRLGEDKKGRGSSQSRQDKTPISFTNIQTQQTTAYNSIAECAEKENLSRTSVSQMVAKNRGFGKEEKLYKKKYLIKERFEPVF